MAEDRLDTRETNWRNLLPWTELFRGFRVAIGLSKLALAAAGILVMALLWYVLAVAFFNATRKPEWEGDYVRRYEGTLPEGAPRRAAGWRDFRQDRDNWNLILETAGPNPADETFEVADLADDPDDYDRIAAYVKKGEREADDNRVHALLDHMAREHRVTRAEIKQLIEYLPIPQGAAKENEAAARADNEARAKAWIVQRQIAKPCGALRTLPWYEDRGPNPFLLVTGQAGVPWETGHFWDWLLTKQGPVLVEPLVKFLRPVVSFFSPRAGWVSRLYFLLVILVTLATWAFFGAAITRLAAVEVARNEKINPLDALRFVGKRYLSYLCAPLFPLAIVAVLVVLLILFGILHLIPGLGDIVIDGLFWWVAVLVGLGIACFLVGLVSWPLMTTTISTEDEEGFNAFARAYSYLIQAPWHYLWYAAVALAYGAVVVFFVGFMGSLAVYLASWGVNKGTFGVQSRNPSFLFVYAPTSFGWRDLLLEGASVQEGGTAVVQEGQINPEAYQKYVGGLAPWNRIGAVLVSIWLGIFFLLVLGFGYSYFWTASSIIYLLLRRRVDDAEMDEVYFEEDEQDEYALGPPAAPKPAAAPTPGMTMVEPPSLRVPTPAAPPPPPPATAPVTPPPVSPGPGASAVPSPPSSPPAAAPEPLGEATHPTTTAVPPPPPHPENLPPDGNGNPPPGGEG
jgi:hypothetical protein